MNANKGLTRVDAIITVACIALVLAQAAVLNAGGRQRSKRELCLANLRMLTAAWKAYADDNGGKLVNGAPIGPADNPPAGTCPAPMAGTDGRTKALAPAPGNILATVWGGNYLTTHQNELPWIGPAYAFDSSGQWLNPLPQTECLQRVAIQTGALWKYTGDYNVYRCPVGDKGELVSYTIMDSMNGKTIYSITSLPAALSASLLMKNIGQISRASSRMVFIDEGQPTPDSYAVYYDQQMWFDLPPVQHENGTCVSFADGHSVFHKWKAKETITIGSSGTYSTRPATCDGFNDLYWVQIGCWGKLGYTPSCPVNIE
jgi:hypothetical protein